MGTVVAAIAVNPCVYGTIRPVNGETNGVSIGLLVIGGIVGFLSAGWLTVIALVKGWTAGCLYVAGSWRRDLVVIITNP